MSMETELRALLQAASIPGTSPAAINWAEHPQGVGRPYVVLTLVNDMQGTVMSGPDGLRSSRVQIDCYATTYAAVAAMRDAVQAAISGFRGGNFRAIIFDGARSLRDPGEAEAVHRMSLDFLTHWRNGNAV